MKARFTSPSPQPSLKEREKRPQRFGEVTAASCLTSNELYEKTQRLFLLPEGEGQDEGEPADQ